MGRLLDTLALLGIGRDLSAEQSHAAVSAIMDGAATEAEIAAFLTGLRFKGETADELAGAVRAARERMTPLEGPFPAVLDTCGTGGDGSCTVNVSTAAALVVASCGVPVAKHGNRSASGNSGSAEVLKELGVEIEAAPEVLARCLLDLGITFLFAPRFHPALKYAGPVRKQLPFRTLFNLIGPLANPVRPRCQLLGVPSLRAADLVARTLVALGTTDRAAVVVACRAGEDDGIDEVALDRPSHVRWVESGEIRAEVWTPEDFGLSPVSCDDLRVSGPADSAERLRRLLAGKPGPVRSIVLANAAAALRVAGRVDSLCEGVARAAEAIDSRGSLALLERWARASRSSPTQERP